MKTTESFLPVFQGTYGTIFEDIDVSRKDDIGIILTDVINEYISDFGIKATFQAFVSPRFYNFSNDSINVVYEYESLDNLKQFIADNLDAVNEELKLRYTPASGFIPYHSTDVQDWVDNLETDEHKFGAMLDICLYVRDAMEYLDIDSEMYERLGQNGLIIYEIDDDETV